MPFLAALALLFIGLKLGGVIAWSWWLVLLPLYGSGVIAAVLMVISALSGLVFLKKFK